jgi:hypothetical protein
MSHFPELIVIDFDKTTKRDMTTVQNAIKKVIDSVSSHRRLDILSSALSAASPANDIYRSDHLLVLVFSAD